MPGAPGNGLQVDFAPAAQLPSSRDAAGNRSTGGFGPTRPTGCCPQRPRGERRGRNPPAARSAPDSAPGRPSRGGVVVPRPAQVLIPAPVSARRRAASHATALGSRTPGPRPPLSSRPPPEGPRRVNMTSPPSNRNTTRSFRKTRTLHSSARSPFKECSPKPGASASPGRVASEVPRRRHLASGHGLAQPRPSPWSSAARATPCHFVIPRPARLARSPSRRRCAWVTLIVSRVRRDRIAVGAPVSLQYPRRNETTDILPRLWHSLLRSTRNTLSHLTHYIDLIYARAHHLFRTPCTNIALRVSSLAKLILRAHSAAAVPTLYHPTRSCRHTFTSRNWVPPSTRRRRPVRCTDW